MDNTNKIALTLGFGALGTVLAYYGYNQLNDEDETTENKEINEVIEKSETDKTNVKERADTKPKEETSKKELNEDDKTIKKETNKEIKELTNVEDKKKQTGNEWSNYWKNQYDKKDPVENNESIAVI